MSLSSMWFEIYEGNAIEKLAQIRERHPAIHSVVTSPPYFQKRHYGNSSLEIGQESSSTEFCENIVKIFNAIPLHSRGSLWINIGDKRDRSGFLGFLPERFCLIMMDYGWRLVDNVIWAKIVDEENGETHGSCMVEPATHRLNGNGYEYFYRFVKTAHAKDAWTDTCAVRLPRQGDESRRYLPKTLMKCETSVSGRCLHNVWRHPMGQTKQKHYAVFPIGLVERPIAMTCPLQVCSQCKEPFVRQIEMVEYDECRGRKRIFGKYNSIHSSEDILQSGRMDSGRSYVPRKPKTIGWKKTCDCIANVEPGIVLDPFCGTGTTGDASLRLGRSFIGIDLYEEYASLAKKRCENTITFLKEHDLRPDHVAK